MIRFDLWLKYVEERMGGMTQVEKKLATSVIDTLVFAPPERQRDPSYESDCVGALVAIVELTRALAEGKHKDIRR